MFWLPELLLWELKLILLVVGGKERGTHLNQLCEELSRPSSPVAGENYKTKTLTVSGNSPNGIQQMEEHLFKKIYSILERPASLWHLNHSLLPSYTLLPIQCDQCLLPAGVRKKTVPPLRSPALSLGPWFLFRRYRPPVFLIPSALCFKFFIPGKHIWNWGLLSSTRFLLIEWGSTPAQILDPSTPAHSLWESETVTHGDFLPETTEAGRLWDNLFKALKEKLDQGSSIYSLTLFQN